jgi:E-phenylitaconyl-CoA hydratase
MPFVLYEKRGHVALMTLNRPDRMNALGRELLRELREAESQFAQDPDASVAVYTGSGDRAFCAGRDLKEAAEATSQTGPRSARAPQAIETTKPTIAAVNGVAYGGGMELAMRCDIRICSENATFAMAEVKVGLVPPIGIYLLPRLIGQSNAMWLLMSGEPIDAAEALRIGFVSRVVPQDELVSTALQMAEVIGGNSPLAVHAVKNLVKLGSEVPLDYAQRLASAHIAAVWNSEDAKEGAVAFAQRRKPVWTGR